jgi:hypothetical protein
VSELRDTVRPAADDAEPDTLRALAKALTEEGSRRLARAADLEKAAKRKERLLAGLALEVEES